MNATALKVQETVAFSSTMSTKRLLRAYLIETKCECLRMFRTPGFAIPFLALPVFLYLLFTGVIFADVVHKNAMVARTMFTAFAVFGLVGPGMFGFGVVLAMEREQGLLKLKRALPMPPANYLLAKMSMCVVFGIMVMTSLILAGLSLGHLELSIKQLFMVGVISVLGALPFCAMGLLVATLVSGRAAAGFVNMIYFPMLYLSGIFFPLPKFLMKIVFIWPTYHLMQLALSAIGWPIPFTIIHVTVLLDLTVLFTWLAVTRLRRVA